MEHGRLDREPYGVFPGAGLCYQQSSGERMTNRCHIGFSAREEDYAQNQTGDCRVLRTAPMPRSEDDHRGLAKLEQAEALGRGHQRESAVRVQLLACIANVVPNRVQAQMQALRDLRS